MSEGTSALNVEVWEEIEKQKWIQRIGNADTIYFLLIFREQHG